MSRKSEDAANEQPMSAQDNDSITVQDNTGRRQFIRRGAAYMAAGGVVAGGLMATSGTAYADDCDQGSRVNKNQELASTDSDSGAVADAEGCGREPEKPKISKLPNSIGDEIRESVGKIKA